MPWRGSPRATPRASAAAAAPTTFPRPPRSPTRRGERRQRARPRAARSATAQSSRLGPFASARNRKITSAMPLQSESSATLNANLTGFWRRITESASPAPTTCAASSAAGEAKKRPSTRPTSVSESVCACLRNWRCTTHASARKKATASPHHGSETPLCVTTGHEPARLSAHTPADAVATAPIKSQTRAAARSPMRSRRGSAAGSTVAIRVHRHLRLGGLAPRGGRVARCSRAVGLQQRRRGRGCRLAPSRAPRS